MLIFDESGNRIVNSDLIERFDAVAGEDGTVWALTATAFAGEVYVLLEGDETAIKRTMGDLFERGRGAVPTLDLRLRKPKPSWAHDVERTEPVFPEEAPVIGKSLRAD
jgi:hypothetical protein